MNRVALAGIVGGVLGLLVMAGVDRRELLNSKLNKLLGVKDTVAIDNPEFCEALAGRKTMFRQTVTGRVEIVIPASSEEEAKLFLMIRRAMLNKQDLSETMDEVNVEGCPGTGLAEEPAVEEPATSSEE